MDTIGLECPVERWPGKAYIKNPIPMVDINQVEEARERISEIDADMRPTARYRLVMEISLPAILRCYDHFELAGLPDVLTVETFPGAPKIDADKLAGWLIDSIMRAYVGDAPQLPLEN